MCGVIGFISQNATIGDLEILKKVMIESRIRGKHASGIAWYDGKSIKSFVKPIAIDELVNEFDFNKLIINKKVAMIAHARYSTSDIRYNQPIVGESMAIVHNGVITQSHPKNWEKQFGYKCKTCNDSELLLRAMENKDEPLKKFNTSSIAALVLKNNGELICMRNSQRPLWMGILGEGTIYASTYDILHRAGIHDIKPVPNFSKNTDLQRRNFKQWGLHK